ncbi:hypothetical protein ASE74_05530 [Pedobacter sp. Leaf216]|nr:hypothetical protein ASE74_05530 [Pedobacter sp. Leaf216]
MLTVGFTYPLPFAYYWLTFAYLKSKEKVNKGYSRSKPGDMLITITNNNPLKIKPSQFNILIIHHYLIKFGFIIRLGYLRLIIITEKV